MTAQRTRDRFLSGILRQLPPAPDEPGDSPSAKAWREWATTALEGGGLPGVLHCTPDEAGEHRRIELAWRYLLQASARERATWVPRVKELFDTCALKFRDEVPMAVVYAAVLREPTIAEDRVAGAALEQLCAVTLNRFEATAESQLLFAAFVWPLGDASELRQRCWDALARWAWYTDHCATVHWVAAVESTGHAYGEWSLIRLTQERERLAAQGTAVHLAEAIAAHHLGLGALSELTQDHSAKVELSAKILDTVCWLAERYASGDEREIHHREILRMAARQDAAYTPVVASRVWNFAYDETYTRSERIRTPIQLAVALREARDQQQFGYAERLCECVVARSFDPVWVGGVERNIREAIDRMFAVGPVPPRVLHQHPLARSAAEHLAASYVQRRVYTPHALKLVSAVMNDPAFVGPACDLRPLRPRMQQFVEEASPGQILRAHQERLNALALNEEEKQVRERILGWLDRRFSPDAPYFGAPRRMFGPVEQAVEWALVQILHRGAASASGLNGLTSRGAQLRGPARATIEQVDTALAEGLWSRRIQAVALGVAAGLIELLPGSVLLGGAIDVVGFLLLSSRVALRARAWFSPPHETTQETLHFFINVLMIALSTFRGEGLVAQLGLGHDSQGASSVTVAGLKYSVFAIPRGVVRLHGLRDAFLERAASRMGLALRPLVSLTLLPLAGAVFSTVAAVRNVKQVHEAAVFLSAQEALLRRGTP